MVLADTIAQAEPATPADRLVRTAASRRPLRRSQRRAFDRLIRYVAKPIVFSCCLAPLAWLGWAAATGGLGVNPIEAVNRFLGDWALRFLLISLAVSPLREITGFAALIRFRRMLGLFAFTYVVLHLSSWIGLDQFFSWPHIWKDIVKRPFITIGMAAFLLLVPLAATSTAKMIKRLGAKRWKRLHMLVYPAAAFGCLHYFMMVKADIREPLIYAGVLATLLGWRAATRWRPALSRPSAPSRHPSASSPG